MDINLTEVELALLSIAMEKLIESPVDEPSQAQRVALADKIDSVVEHVRKNGAGRIVLQSEPGA